MLLMDKARQARLERIEQYAEQLHDLWQGDMFSEPDMEEFEVLMNKFMHFIGWGYDEQ